MAYPIRSNRINQTGYENGRSLGFVELRNHGMGEMSFEDIAALANPTGSGTGTPMEITDEVVPYMVPPDLQPYAYTQPGGAAKPGTKPVTSNNVNLLIGVVGVVALLFMLKK